MHANVFETLADPMRRRIVESLLDGERQVNDIVERLDIHQSGVSRHLKILQQRGFVRMRPDGQRRLYSLRPEPLKEAESWMHRYAHEQAERLKRLAELVDEPEKDGKKK